MMEKYLETKNTVDVVEVEKCSADDEETSVSDDRECTEGTNGGGMHANQAEEMISRDSQAEHCTAQKLKHRDDDQAEQHMVCDICDGEPSVTDDSECGMLTIQAEHMNSTPSQSEQCHILPGGANRTLPRQSL